MDDKRRFYIVTTVVTQGKPYNDHVLVDGNRESGPYTIDYRGYRWGQVKVYVHPTGHMWLEWNITRRTDDPWTHVVEIFRNDPLYAFVSEAIWHPRTMK